MYLFNFQLMLIVIAICSWCLVQKTPLGRPERKWNENINWNPNEGAIMTYITNFMYIPSD
jgi:hypothetical protein